MVTNERPPPLQLVNEVARLAALRSYHVLDNPDIAGLEGLVQGAALCMGRPMAALSLVDTERLWLGAAIGIPWRETLRAGSYCSYAIDQSGPLVVRDGQADARFREHPIVRGAGGLRFYAGVSLDDEDGYRLGTLCVFDERPGPADPAALSELARLATMATAALGAYRDSLAQLPPGALAPSPDRVQGWLGVRTRGSSHLHASAKPGLIVLSVAADSPAERAGLRPTDVLIAIDGRVLRHPADVVNALANRPLDGLARLHVLRAGKTLERVVPVEPEPGTRASLRVAAADAGYGFGAGQ